VTDFSNNTVDYDQHSGGPPAGPPGAQRFWEASSTGPGQVTTSWKVSGGDWSIVAMNATGAPRVSADVRLGAKTNAVLWIGVGFLVVGLLFAGGGIAMLVAGSRPRY
jgi:hypothetical protein